ncbi:MAG: hypothetical protein BWK74_00795 [Desulfobacteraceae bacterium A6]|nr:MAG: hypothetical protein BWK74_00795 [Desulfobacteraceae bacterium A6]
MKFILLLFVLAQKLKAAAKKNTAYRKHLGIMQISVLIKTTDGKRGRLFIFDKGTFSSVSGTHHQCDVALVWADAGTAFKVMTSKTGDADTFRAAAEGKVRVEGMVPYLQWFTDGVKLVMG